MIVADREEHSDVSELQGELGLSEYTRPADLPALLEGHVPAQELVGGHAGASTKLQPTPRQMIQHRCVLRQPYRIMEGQLIDHHPKSDRAGIARQGGQVHAG